MFTNWNYEPIKNIVPIENANVGDYIHFGKNLTDFIHYDIEEIDSWDNYKSDIEWRVLDKKDDKILVISRHVIWCILFDNKEKCTWEDSNMRLRLNSVFIEQTFNDDEKEKIIDDDEKIFLLSEEEVKKYFSDDNDRRCKATYNMRQNGCWYSLESDVCGNCWYWLRTLRQGFIDENEIKAPDGFMYVNEYGEIITTGERANLNTSNIGVRPAMWIKIN